MKFNLPDLWERWINIFNLGTLYLRFESNQFKKDLKEAGNAIDDAKTNEERLAANKLIDKYIIKYNNDHEFIRLHYFSSFKFDELEGSNNLKPSDFFFHVEKEVYHTNDGPQENGNVIILMCPIEFFQKNGYMLDKHLNIDNLLPDFMDERRAATFDSSFSVEETRQELLNRGFKEDIFFSDFLMGTTS